MKWKGAEISFLVRMGHGCYLTVWADEGEVPDSVSKWPSYADLVQILWELGMGQAMFSLNTCGPDDECFTAGMRDLVLQHVPSASFGSLMTNLDPCVSTVLMTSPQWWQVWERQRVRGRRKEFGQCLETPLSLQQKTTPCG